VSKTDHKNRNTLSPVDSTLSAEMSTVSALKLLPKKGTLQAGLVRLQSLSGGSALKNCKLEKTDQARKSF
jgi:hypothetical protein